MQPQNHCISVLCHTVKIVQGPHHTTYAEQQCHSPSLQCQAAHCQHHTALTPKILVESIEAYGLQCELCHCYFHSFSAVKQHLSGTYFMWDYYVKTSATRWLHQQGHEFFWSQIDKLVVWFNKCLNHHDDYIKKQCLTSTVTNTFLHVHFPFYYSNM